MVEDHYRLKRLEMALFATRILLKSTRICNENMPKTTLLATLPRELPSLHRRSPELSIPHANSETNSRVTTEITHSIRLYECSVCFCLHAGDPRLDLQNYTRYRVAKRVVLSMFS